MDVDGSGALDEDEIKQVLMAGNDGFIPSDIDIRGLMDEIDADGNGVVDLEEFEVLIRHILTAMLESN